MRGYLDHRERSTDGLPVPQKLQGMMHSLKNQ